MSRHRFSGHQALGKRIPEGGHQFDVIRFKTETIKYSELRTLMLNDCGMEDMDLRFALEQVGCVITDGDTDLWFVVDSDTMKKYAGWKVMPTPAQLAGSARMWSSTSAEDAEEKFKALLQG